MSRSIRVKRKETYICLRARHEKRYKNQYCDNGKNTYVTHDMKLLQQKWSMRKRTQIAERGKGGTAVTGIDPQRYDVDFARTWSPHVHASSKSGPSKIPSTHREWRSRIKESHLV